MSFIRKMRKREFLEIGFKWIAAFCAAVVAIVLMEGMIYAINLNALKSTTETNYTTLSTLTIAYCIEESDNQYFVIFYNEGLASEWTTAGSTTYTKEYIEANIKGGVLELYYHAPNAFNFTITSTHYIVMAVFLLLVSSYFIYKFFAVDKEYRSIIKRFNETGEIDLELS